MSGAPKSEDKVDLAGSTIPHQPYIPASRSLPELTLRGLVLGSILGVLFAASSVYLAVKVGMTVSASIPVAVLSIAVFRALGKSSILENTIVQTTGSAGESLAFGVAAALPALLFMGYDLDLWHSFLVAALGGILGVLMMIPLRQGLIVQEHGKLAYPEGTACADVLIVGEQGGTNARTVVTGFLVGVLYKFLYAGLHLWREVVETPLSWVTRGPGGKALEKGFLGASISGEISPELLGVGYIIGPGVAGITFAGGVLSYLILIPMIKFFGQGLSTALVSPDGMLIRDMTPDQVRDHYVLYIGAGAVATGGLISLIRSFPTIVSAFKRGLQTFFASRRRAANVPQLPRTEQDLPITIVIFGSLAMIVGVWLAPPLHVNFFSAVLIVIFGFFFVTVSSRITGEIGSSSNPISGMIVATLLATCLIFLLMGWTSASDRFMALTTAAIVGIAASNGGTTSQDLKTAYLVGGTPKRQQISLFVGVITSAMFIGWTLVLLNQAGIARIPERHPGQKLDVVTNTLERQEQFPLQIDRAALKHAGLSLDQLTNDLWAKGYDLEQSPGGAAQAKTFGEASPESLRALTLPSVPGLTLGQVAKVGPAREVSYRVGYARGGSDLLSGKYLVDAQGQIQYLEDPGIGGRFSEFRGRKLSRYDAPKARLFSLIIDGILTQKLPWDLVLLGVFISLMLELCGVSSLPFSVGVYLPISTTTPIFVGGMIRYFADKLRGGSGTESEFSPGTLISSGYIAGGAIAGVLLAVVTIAGGDRLEHLLNLPALLSDHFPRAFLGRLLNTIGDSDRASPLWSNLWGIAVFTLLSLFLFQQAKKHEPAGPR